MWQLEAFYIIPLLLTKAGIIPNKLHASLKPLNPRSALYILMQQAPILRYMPYSLKVFSRTVNEDCLVSGIYVIEDDGDDYNNHNNQLYNFSDFGG
jgi:hypothetical protein